MKASKRQVGGFRWYVLRIMTGREDMVENCLAHRGFATFCPFHRRWHWANGVARKRRIRHSRMVPLYAGYCFIGMSQYTPSWSEVWPLTPVLCVLGHDGVPMIVDHRPFKKLLERHGDGEFNAPNYQRAMSNPDHAHKVGDDVLSDGGLIPGKVEQITGRKARLLVNLFGSIRTVTTDVDSLVAA